jgi:hypothetical protein
VLAGALVAITVALTGLVRVGVLPREAVPAVERAGRRHALAVRHLVFADRADGAVVVQDSDRGQRSPCWSAKTTAAVSVRGVMRGMARERRMNGIGPARRSN